MIQYFSYSIERTTPFPSGQEVSLEEAEARAGIEIFVPAGPMATSDAETWYGPLSDEVVQRFGPDLVVVYNAWEPGQDPAAESQSPASSWGAGKSSTIDGHPAWIVPEGAQDKGHPPVSVVHITISDADITLFGKMPIDDLIEIADGLEPVTG